MSNRRRVRRDPETADNPAEYRERRRNNKESRRRARERKRLARREARDE